jgi:hypothetical protein
VEAWLSSGSWREKIAAWEFPESGADADVPGPVVRRILPMNLAEELSLDLVCSVPGWSSRYLLTTAPAIMIKERKRGLNA